ncbi:Retrovirus-related Pol polyprotein from transposon [Trichinella britovi]|uniref:RNA-directed DNA polymerase n=1 Tax=Trichinella britovi TaxID=45882 RepID=A0A0V1C5W3_TRIBR|nr:Retrovirus-related Pol polyprotein from transposon [Trichinella britovi]
MNSKLSTGLDNHTGTLTPFPMSLKAVRSHESNRRRASGGHDTGTDREDPGVRDSPQEPPAGSHMFRSLWSQRDRLTLRDGILCRAWEATDREEEKMLQVVPRRNIPEVLRAVHNHPTGGHLGVAKTLGRVRQRFYWPQQREEVEDRCRACQTCAARAAPTKRLQAPMQIHPVGQPFQRVGMDLVGPLEETRRGNQLHLGGVPLLFNAFPLPDAEADTVATALVNGIFCRYGAAETLHSDQGRNFEAGVIAELCRLFDVTKTRTTAYHPQSDGLVVRMTRTLIDMLGKVSIDQPEDWDAHLDRVLLAYRSSVHRTTGATPCRIIFGRELRLPVDVVYGLPQGMQAETSGVYVQRLRQELEQSEPKQSWSSADKSHGDKRHAYEPGDQVRFQVPVKTKLGAHWEGRYLLQKKLDWNTYRLRKIRGGKEPEVVHFDRLKPYHDWQQIAETWEVGRKRRTTRRPAWLRRPTTNNCCASLDKEDVEEEQSYRMLTGT